MTYKLVCEIPCSPLYPLVFHEFDSTVGCKKTGTVRIKLTHFYVEGYGGSTAYAGNVKEAARRETCAETFYDAF
jgi:hypothetical protein